MAGNSARWKGIRLHHGIERRRESFVPKVEEFRDRRRTEFVKKAEDSSDDALRAQIVEQLTESLARSREMMVDKRLEPKVRERWTQLHTNTAQVLNQVLRDQQAKDWEKRLKELEAAGHLPRRISLPGTPKWEDKSSRSGEAT